MDFIFTVLALAALAYFGLQLYTKLGRHEGHMEAPSQEPAEAAPSNVVDLQPRPEIPSGPAAAGLEAISRMDQTFDPALFLDGARGAYRMIVEAFAEGDKDKLRPLLSDSVYDRYAEAIDGRRARGESVKTEIDRIAETEIVDASLDENIARVSVGFTADIATETTDREGKPVAGDIHQLNTVRERWTFQRDVESRDPNWKLASVATL